MSCSLNIKNLSVKRDGKTLFENLSLNVSHKEKIAIIGSNGCGKTTLLETIVGFHAKTYGEVELFHKKINSSEDFKGVSHMAGYLLQDSDNQFLALNVEDDIGFSLLAKGAKKQEVKTKTDKIMKDLDISHLAKKIVYQLSGGEKKLVALAGVLITEPKLLLLDEPTSGLDFAMQLRLMEILKNLDKSVIVVSHDKEFVEGVVDKVYKITANKLELISGKEHEYVHSHDGVNFHSHPHKHD